MTVRHRLRPAASGHRHLPLSHFRPLKVQAALGFLGAILALTTPAQAGHWVFTVSGKGSATAGGNQVTFTAPGPSTKSVSLPTIGTASGNTVPVNATANLSVNITGTWTNDTNSDNTLPPSVMVYEQSFASASDTSSNAQGSATPSVGGSAADGLGDPVTAAGVSSGQKYVTETGSPFTISLKLSASASGTPGPSGWTGGSPGQGQYFVGKCSAGAQVGPVTITIHAQPYNMRLTPWTDGNNNPEPAVVTDNTTGTLYFHYSFSSTDGIIADALSDVSMYEYLDWSGNSVGTYGGGGYTEPNPPVNTIDPNNGATTVNPSPQTVPANASNAQKGELLDVFSPPVYGFVAPYVQTSWHVVQNYYFDDKSTDQTKVIVPGPDDHSPYNIVRSVTPGTTTATGTYLISRDGHFASKNLP